MPSRNLQYPRAPLHLPLVQRLCRGILLYLLEHDTGMQRECAPVLAAGIEIAGVLTAAANGISLHCLCQISCAC